MEILSATDWSATSMITKRFYHKNRYGYVYACKSRNCLISPPWYDELCLDTAEA